MLLVSLSRSPIAVSGPFDYAAEQQQRNAIASQQREAANRSQEIANQAARQAAQNAIINNTLRASQEAAQKKSFGLARFHQDGRLDQSFGNDGLETFSSGLTEDDARALTILDDGRILIAGTAYGHDHKSIALARYGTQSRAKK